MMLTSNPILEQSDFEALRLYDPDSTLHKEIGEKVRQIFIKLFQNTDINIDDFYFTGFDSDEANAFFISADKTKNGKNVIAVSYGLIMALSNTEELAAIIGHECGHYLWSQLLGGRNTIFQERAADLRSVDLMMNAGYNPRNVLSAEKKVFGKLDYKSATLDVHGNSFNRIEDVKTYLTKLSLERGYFPEVTPSDPKYDAFKQKLQETRKNEPYLSFLDKAIQEYTQTPHSTQIEREQTLSAISYYLDDIIKNETRIKGLVKLYQQFDYANNLAPERSRETTLLELIVEKLIEKSETNPTIEGYIWQILSLSQLKMFGKFTELYYNVARLISPHEYKIEEAAKEIVENAVYIPLATALTNFTEHTIEFIPTPDIIGKKPYWVRLREKNDPEINQALSLVSQRPTRMLIYNENDYLYDESGNIIAYGEERDRIVQEEKDRQNIIKANEIFDKWANAHIEQLAQYEKIKDFLDGKIDPKNMDYDFVMKTFTEWVRAPELESLYNINGDKYILQQYINKLDKTKVLNHYNALISSSYYRDYKKYIDGISDKNSLDIVVNAPKQLPEDIENSKILDYISLLSYRTMRQYITECTVCDAYIKMGEYYHKTNALTLEETLYTNLLNQYSACQPETKQYISEKMPPYISKNPFAGPRMYDIIVNSILSDIDENKTDIIENIIKCLGFKRLPKTEEELLFFIKQLQLYNFHYVDGNVESELCAFNPFFHYDSVYPLLGIQQIGTALLVNYMASGYKCNPVKIIKSFNHDDSYPFMDKYKDIIIKLIPYEMFDSFTLEDKIYLYEFMNVHSGFSEHNANKNYFIKQIVNQIITYPDYDTAVEYAEKILMRKNIFYATEKRDINDIEFANEREKLIEFYSDYWAQKLGADDDSPEFAQKARELAHFLEYEPQTEPHATFRNKDIQGPLGNISLLRRRKKPRNFTKIMAGALADKIANKIYAQENVTRILDSVNDRTINGGEVEKLDFFGRSAETLFSLLAGSPEKALATIEFINGELTDESIRKLFSIFTKRDRDQLNKQSLTILYENFWAADLPIRAYLMNRLLNAYSTEDGKKLQLILDMFFKQDSEYYNDAQLILKCIYKNLDEIERGLILAALIASGKKSGENEMTSGTAVGRGLKMFLQNKGPAFIKFGQLLSYLPNLDADIRHELSTLRDKAKIPTRAELFDMLRTSLPESEFNKISYVGGILGAGSFFVTVHVKYDDKDCVISLMRPNTQKLTSDGINMIAKTIQDMTAQDPKFAVLTNIVNQARDSAYSEIDIEQDHKKYADAVKIYESFTVHTPMGDYSPDVARWMAYGAAPNKDNAYKIMEMSPGVPLTSEELTEDEKHDMALAYTTLELAILLSGNKWDTDRHAGQQNFSNPAFREFCIGIFDTGAQMNNAPNRRDKRIMGYLLYLLINGVRNGKSISEVLTTSVQDIDRVCEKYGISTAYIDGVQRGITALSDIIQYQKEARDDNGNIVQEAKSLTAEDLENIAVALIESGVIDRTLINTTKTHFVLDVLSFWKSKENAHPLSLPKRESPISITVGAEVTAQIQTHRINKAQEEINKMIAKQRAEEHLGVKVGLTEKKQPIPTGPQDLRRA